MTLTLKKLLLIIAGAIGVVAAFLPWYKISVSFFGYSSSTSANAFELGGILYKISAILAILAFVAVILSAVIDEKKIKKLVKIKDVAKTTMIVGIVMAAVTVINFIALQSESKNIGAGGASWGIWLMAIASVATIVLSVLKNKELDKVIAGAKPADKKSEKSGKK